MAFNLLKKESRRELMRSWNDESRFTVHTAAEVIDAYQDGESVK